MTVVKGLPSSWHTVTVLSTLATWLCSCCDPACREVVIDLFSSHFQPKDSELKPQRSKFQTVSTNNEKTCLEKR